MLYTHTSNPPVTINIKIFELCAELGNVLLPPIDSIYHNLILYKFSRITLIFFLNLATFFFKVFIIWVFFLYILVFKLTLNTKKSLLQLIKMTF